MREYSCGTCQTKVADSENSIQCDRYDTWDHAICVDVSDADYEKL